MQKTHERLKIPHMGWGNSRIKKETALYKKIKNRKLEFEKSFRILCSGYNFFTKNEKNKIMTTDYEQEITAMISENNIIGTQFLLKKVIFLDLFFRNLP